MHAVHGEVGRDSTLGSSQALRDDCAAIDAAGARRVPEWACVGEQIGVDVR